MKEKYTLKQWVIGLTILVVWLIISFWPVQYGLSPGDSLFYPR